MAKNVIMPDLSTLDYQMETGTVERWLKNEGDPVAKGESLCEISTFKVTMDLESPYAGILRKRLVKEGEEVPPGEVLAILD